MPNHSLVIMHLTPGITHRIYQKIKHSNISLDDFIDRPQAYQEHLFLKKETIDFITEQHYLPLSDALQNWLEKDPKHHIITLDDQIYPKQLKEIADPPFVLYAIGNIELISNPQLAIVGTRNNSRYGEDVVCSLIPDLIDHDLTITSGMAIGIDALAHKQTLKLGGNTIAVLGTGIDICYPYQNKKLYNQIQQQGLVISEFPLHAKPKRHHFPQRNRIISGLSLGVLVVEAAYKSGSLLTAFHAMDQNREVFAVPANIFHNTSQGCHRLLQMGAKLVTNTNDILDELKLSITTEKPTVEKENLAAPDLNLSAQAQSVYDHIGSTCTTIDQIIAYTNLTYTQINGILFDLEMGSLIQAVPGGYQRL